MADKARPISPELADALDVVSTCRDDPQVGENFAFQLVLARSKGEGLPGLVRMIGGFTSLVGVLLARQHENTGQDEDEILDDIRKHPP
jgi:hypothetical protein